MMFPWWSIHQPFLGPSRQLRQGINDDTNTGEDDADSDEEDDEETAYDIAYKVLRVTSDEYAEDDEV